MAAGPLVKPAAQRLRGQRLLSIQWGPRPHAPGGDVTWPNRREALAPESCAPGGVAVLQPQLSCLEKCPPTPPTPHTPHAIAVTRRPRCVARATTWPASATRSCSSGQVRAAPASTNTCAHTHTHTHTHTHCGSYGPSGICCLPRLGAACTAPHSPARGCRRAFMLGEASPWRGGRSSGAVGLWIRGSFADTCAPCDACEKPARHQGSIGSS